MILLRFDDICETMNWEIWREIEKVLLDLGIHPIIAVVPKNEDLNLRLTTPCQKFWGHVQRWQQENWTIALHGYRHKYANKARGILGIGTKSEFAGICESEQRIAISAGIQIFQNNNVVPQCWVAPSHSFDRTTVKVLKEFHVTTISDGLSRFPYRDDNGMFWIPQQQWSRIVCTRRGVVTVCYHHNRWGCRELNEFRVEVERFRESIVDVAEVFRLYGNRRRSLEDVLWANGTLIINHRMRPFAARLLKKLS